MKKQRFISSLVTVAVMALGSVSALAQGNAAVPAQPDPAKGGEGSTVSPKNGTTNPPQLPDGSAPASRASVKSEARVANRNNANSLVPKGEASTTINNQPNATPQPTGDMSRREVSMSGRHNKPQFGNKGERPDVPTNPMDKTGTPK